MENGRIFIYIGDENGGSPTVLGMALQAACIGRDVVIVRFMKERGMSDSEFVRRLEPEIKIFRFEKSDENFKQLSQERQAEEIRNIRNGLNFAKKVMNTGECSLLILDEILELLDNDIITAEELKQLVLCKPEDMDVIITGNTLNAEIEMIADEVTKIVTVQSKISE